MRKNKDLVLYSSPDGAISLPAKMENDDMWLSLKQIAALFGRDKSGISRHIKKIVESGELSREGTVAQFATVETEGERKVSRDIEYFNLDMIISIGYRVDSKQATHFRKRATSTLRGHIVDGYSINPKRLEQTGVEHLQQSLTIVKRALENKKLSDQETKGLLDLLVTYLPGFLTLGKFEANELPEESGTTQEIHKIERLEAIIALSNLKTNLVSKGEATELFAHPKSDGAIDFCLQKIYEKKENGEDKNSSVEAKAATLLYEIIISQPFADGNKRCAAFLFLRYLKKNNALLNNQNKEKISQQTLVAITLLIGASSQTEKEMIIRLIGALL